MTTHKKFAGILAVLALVPVAFSASPAELEKDFDAARKAGDPLAADRAFIDLVAEKPNVSPIRYFQAAFVARDMRKFTVMRDRLTRYLALEKAFTPEVEQAAWWLCRNGGGVDAYARLTAGLPESDRLYRQGVSMLQALMTARRTDEYLKLAKIFMNKFKLPEQRAQATSGMFTLVQWGAPGATAEKIVRFGEQYRLENDGNAHNAMVAARDYCNAAWVIDYCDRHQCVLPYNNLFERVWGLKDMKDLTVRKNLAGKLAKLESRLFTTNTFRQAMLYYNLCRVMPFDFKNGSQKKDSSAKLARVFRAVAGVADRKNSSQVSELRGAAAETIRAEGWTKPDLDALRQSFAWAFRADGLLWAGGAGDQAKATTNLAPVRALLKRTDNRSDVRWEARGLFAAMGDKQTVLAILDDMVRYDPQRFNWTVMFELVAGCKGMGEGEKATVFSKFYDATGYAGPWHEIARRANPKDKHWAFLATTPEGKAFVAKVNSKAGAKDRLMAIRNEIWGMRRENNTAPAKALQLLADACQIYKGPYWPETDSWQAKCFRDVVDAYVSLANWGPAAAKRYCELMPGRLTKGMDWWNGILRMADNCGEWDLRLKMYGECARVTGRTDCYSRLQYPTNTTKIAVAKGVSLGAMSASSMGDFMSRNFWDRSRRFQGEAAETAANAFFSAHPLSSYGDWTLYAFDRYRGDLAARPSAVASFPWETVAKQTLDGECAYKWSLPYRVLDAAFVAKRGEAMLARYLAGFDSREPASRLTDLMELMRCDFLSDTNNAAAGKKDFYGQVLRTRLPAALKAVPDAQAPLVHFNGWTFARRLDAYCDRADNRKDEALQKTRDTVYLELARLFRSGANGFDSNNGNLAALGRAYAKALAATNRVEMAKYAAEVGARADGGWYWALDLLNRTRAAKCWEALYLMCANVPENGWNDMVTAAARYRGEAASHLTGIYPVGEKHPAYPLYVAADQLSRRNPERAWEILKNPRTLTVFEREAPNLPPAFTEWAVEQLRMARGPKDSYLQKARQIATGVLAHESKITPALAAAMVLTRAECYRDMQNFEAAKLEYQTIRNSPVYSKTPSGRKAMFRDTDLMIVMGNVSGAEQAVEYWLSQSDPDILAEAHYFLARIAFDRKDFDETARQLRQVFEIDFTHTEARFLQGQWKLATNSEVDETEVMVGDLADRTAIRPGQQLSVTVQDRNLAVAGGGASIPLVITATPGGDVERIFLYPSVRDPNLFKGVIDVKLAKASPTNLTLEVSGRDEVAYRIDPEFLKNRGLPMPPAKRLRVIDDAKLAIGAGAPRTEEEDTEADLEAALEANSPQGGRTANLIQSVRPGNPIYIAVSDKDRSDGSSNCTVSVRVQTSSGDRLASVLLEEVAPFTGTFRGSVPTQLPPPRAFASDSAVGSNPGDTINSTRDGAWKSVADNQPGKWLEVDTMASHRVSNATIRLTSPEEIRAVRLVGRLGNETMRLGSFPAENVARRSGLRRQHVENPRPSRSEESIRTWFTGTRAPTSQPVQKVSFTSITNRWSRNVGQNALYSGGFIQPKDRDMLRLRIAPKRQQGDTFRGLWLAIAIDGTTLFSGQGPSLADRIVSFDMKEGAHLLEVFVAAGSEWDSFDLLWEPDPEKPGEDLPMSWFDLAVHPELKDFLADAAKIVRTPEGFSANFVKPTRIRSLRWEFVERSGPDVGVQKLYVTDTKGRTVIPVETDFSDAQSNDTLEVAPGDSVSVSYEDAVTSSGEQRVLQRTMASSFNNATIDFMFEDVTELGNGQLVREFRPAFRFQPGDAIILSVVDPDMDLSEERDRVKVRVKARSGAERDVTLVEQKDPNQRDDDPDAPPDVHTGRFLGLLRTTVQSDTNSPAKVMRVTPTDVLELAYEDRENTNPGVPFLRKCTVKAMRSTEPQVTLFHSRTVRVEDKGRDAEARLAAIRRRPGNENVTKVYRDALFALPMARALCDSTNPIPVNVAAPIPVRVNDPARARHSGSRLWLEASSASEEAAAAAEGRDAEKVTIPMPLGGAFPGFTLKKGAESQQEARDNGSFGALVKLRLGPPDPNAVAAPGAVKELGVTGSDTIRLRVFAKKDDEKPLLERKLKLVSNGAIALMDSSWSAERTSAHMGERFFVQVTDADRDATEANDRIEVDVKSLVSGNGRKVVLTETMPHSGTFTGVFRPVVFGPEDKIPNICTGAVAAVQEMVAEDRFPASFGDRIVISYRDELTLPGTEPRTLCATGSVFRGANGTVKIFSKRFRDTDEAVLVQFRLAECLFEQAKEHRKLKQPERSAALIAEGRFILEEALKNYPDSAHAAQGEFLLANLYQELGMEQKTAGDKTAATPFFTEALARFSAILSAWPDGEFAARSQYHKAYCLEMLGDYPRASEEYVKMTYLFPESDLVGDATVRLANYYYKQAKRYDVAGRIYANFQRRFPTHEKAARALFMSGSCFVKQGEYVQEEWDADPDHVNSIGKMQPQSREMFKKAVDTFASLNDQYHDTTSPAMRAQALYWAGDVSFRIADYKNAYIYLKRVTFEYPETEWARRARGLLLQESEAFGKMEQQEAEAQQ